MRRTVQSIGGLFALLALTLLVVALCTSKWLSIQVDRDLTPALSGGGLASYTRHRGIYKECWTDSSVMTNIAANDYFLSDLCLHLDMRVQIINPDVSYSDDYKLRTGLLIAMWAVLGLSVFFTFVALVLYCYTLCHHVNKYQWKHGCKASAGLMFAAVLLNGLGMGLYHGAEQMELNTVTDPSARQAPYSMFFLQDQNQDLINRTTRMYGWSYALSWCAVACELLSSVLFMSISCCYVKSTKTKSKMYAKPVPKQTTVVVGQRNPAYDIIQEKVLVAPPKVYVVQGGTGDYYQDGRGSYDPYSNGQPQNGYSPRYNYDKGWVVQ